MHPVCSKPHRASQVCTGGGGERRESRTHRVRFIFSRFSSLLGPLPELLSMGPQSCWTARNMALCILVLTPPGLGLAAAGRASGPTYSRSRLGGGASRRRPRPRSAPIGLPHGLGGGVSLAPGCQSPPRATGARAPLTSAVSAFCALGRVWGADWGGPFHLSPHQGASAKAWRLGCACRGG